MLLVVSTSLVCSGMCGGLVVSLMDCQSSVLGFKSQSRIMVQDFSSTCVPSQLSYDEYSDCIRCQWEDKTAKERTCHLLLYAKAKKIKLQALHTLLFFLYLDGSEILHE